MLALKAAALLAFMTTSFRSQVRAQSTTQSCEDLVGGYNTTVLMVADPGSFSGSAEAKYYLANLENATYVPPGSTICVSRAHGKIMGQNVTVVSSGINAQNAAMCVMEILSCATHVKEIIYSGTSGFSPALGGIVNPPDCVETAMPETITRLGDVCVTPFANNWECRLASWSQQCTGYPNQCTDPELTDNLTVSALYGQCSFDSYDQASVDLADEILAAAQANSAASNALRRNTKVENYEQAYWAAMSNGTGETFLGTYNGLGAPSIYGYDKCAETDGQFFWSGAPWDFNARTYVAYTLSTALGKDITPYDVIAVSAMEAVGVAAAMAKYSAIPGNPKIPYTFVRGSSDYVHLPLSSRRVGVWDEVKTVPPVDFVNGYAYAIASYSTVVLDLLTARCMNASNDNSTACQFMGGGVQYASA